MSVKDLKREPHHLEEDVWWYETSKGIEVIIHFAPGDIRNYVIPWRTIRSVLKRKDKLKGV